MAIENKYRVHEVAKDFGAATKEITEILTQYCTTPKNHMQVLSDQELSVIFEYMTQHHQVNNMEETLNAQMAARQTAAAPSGDRPKAEEKLARQPQAAQQPVSAKPEAGKKEESKAAPAASTKVKQVHRIDTRGAGDVNLDKYDERIDKLVDAKAERMESRGQKKQKLTKKADQRAKPFGNKRRQEEQEKMKRLQRQQQMAALKKIPVKVMIPDEISVGELASRMKRTAADVIKGLIKLGVMASISEIIDFDTAAIVAEEMGCKVEKEVHITIEERLFDESEDREEDLVPRDPVVVVMGHVDHGKTSLLDAIRKTKVTEGEAGGITQHIGAYRVAVDGKPITFLDTPGHAAFTSMRARGAQVTDIAILVVAADDGVMPQTIEAINHAKAANVPIIVAVNKIDKQGANPDRVLQQLTEYEIVPEEWGGDTIVCNISAKFGQGIENLLEMVLLTAEVADLKANPNRKAHGTVIEAKLDKGRGPVATLLVQNGTLHTGDTVIAGKAVGRVRAMTNDDGKRIQEAGPSVPVEIIGLAEVPGAGDIFDAVDDEKMARELVEQRKDKEKEERNKQFHKVTLDNLFASIQEGEMKELNIIVKADVQGSVEAIRSSLEKLSNDEVRVKVIHGAVGAINESDVMLAAASGAIIVGFNVRPDRTATDSAAQQGVDMRMYRVIYDAIEEMEQAMKGMLEPKFKEVVLGHAEVRQVFKITGAGAVAGCYVQDGKIQRNAEVRVVRDGIVFHEGHLNTLKRFKDDVKEVASGYECGMSIENYNDIKENDVIECFVMEEVKP
ncbi:translation initiation factor IF-2 [Agathobaculum sp. NSJ-28]|uniref:Translation initiation factor IF-2 n=2 Tax=Agathobaculum TaxID=2048137 RepID=A0A923LXF1_9FIRM|nr:MULTISPECIES: translation initiation factor IF-2 [Butyricicoccaceae]MBS6882424.1 translation initiation factor IF-2 [Clostridiaceae bacterium]SCJ46455.1 Translation initiation factor IF-2 [uncultured Butyricicoccus sp.]MBC5725692.1 translation initiation factor IF-2 [Agathobaculum faecis]MCU6789998.1 translation initiation factor IF-2 [Agathobaculum ammoniilyticum]WOC74958.1 translation initiation factor IF-2 [Intestinibacillus sp. NTUH-41-i26]